ncbi:MAG: GNAT family N-acetyltransferase [Phycisphaeraceae bacterium]|nr:GNAT family N-acetyltransferase [Phycisphaeraceae bacterium]
MEGRFCRLEPLDPERHAEALYAAHSRDATGRTWTYLPYGPFDSLDAYRSWMDSFCRQDDPLFFVILTESERAPVGVASYLRIAPGNGAIEVGHIHYTELLRKRPAATEAMYLMMSNAFDLGYRRYEWKCDALNAASRTAARRLGFSFEGIFRQATVYKGRNRDTAWFAVIDSEWDALNGAYQKWLDPGNFDGDGRQRTRLSDLTRTLPRREA